MTLALRDFQMCEALVAETEVAGLYHITDDIFSDSSALWRYEETFFQSEIVVEDIHKSTGELPHPEPAGFLLEVLFFLARRAAAQEIVVIDYLSQSDAFEEEVLHHVRHL